MKRIRLLVKILPTACLILLLLSIVRYSNEQTGRQQKNTLNAKQTVGAFAKEHLSEPVYDIKKADETTKDTVLPSVNEDIPKDHISPIKSTDNGIAAVTQNNVAYDTNLDIYDRSRITTVTSIDDLHSEHPYANYTDHLWVYQQANAPVLRVSFSKDTRIESGLEYIYLYDKNNKMIGSYSGVELQGKTVTVWGDTIKIRLCAHIGFNHYGFAVTDISIPAEIEDYYVDYQKIPNKLYLGDIMKRPLQYVKKTLQNGVITTTDLTESVHFVWKDAPYNSTKYVDITTANKELSITVKNIGNVSGYIEVYNDTDDRPVATSPRILFSTDNVMSISGYTDQTIMVNQISTILLGAFTIRGEIAYPSITKVTSSDDSIVSYVPNGTKNGYHFTLLGEGKGNATVTVSYTIKDGDKTTNGTRVFNITCINADYYPVFSQNTEVNANNLLPTQTAEYKAYLSVKYYDNNNKYQDAPVLDFTDYTIEVTTFEDYTNIVKVSVSGDKVTIKALGIGSGRLRACIKKDEEEVAVSYLYFNISNERYLFQYDEPRTLYPSQCVHGPALYHYTYKNGKLSNQKVNNAVITCSAGSNDPITYADNELTAVREVSNYNITFTCQYGGNTWDLRLPYTVTYPSIKITELPYKNDTVKLSLYDDPILDKDWTVTWSVTNKDTSTTAKPLASIQPNADRTATLSCIDTGYIVITATISKGEEPVFSPITYGLYIKESKTELFESSTLTLKVNQTDSITAHDYQINSNYYDTTITDVENENPDMVEVLNYTRIPGSTYDSFNIAFRGKQITGEDLKIKVKYFYINQHGNTVHGEETITVSVVGNSFSCEWDQAYVPALPGTSIPLKIKLKESGYDKNGLPTSSYVESIAIGYNIEYDPTKCASLEDDKIIFSTNAIADSVVSVKAKITYNGKDYESPYRRFYINAGYYEIRNVAEDFNSIKLGEAKTLRPELYLYDKDNPSGKKIEDVEFKWEEIENQGTFISNLTNDYFTTNGMSITGTELGWTTAYLIAIFKDDGGSSTTYRTKVTVQIVPREIPDLPFGERKTVQMPGNFYKIKPDTTGTYMISLSENMESPLIELYDTDWKLIQSYDGSTSIYKDTTTIPVTLEGGKTYILNATSSLRTTPWISWPSSSICVTPGTIPKAIDQCEVTLSAQKFTYNGAAYKPTVTVKDGNTLLQKDLDYVIYRKGSNTNCGIFTLEIRGINNYTGCIYKSCTIKELTLTGTMVQLSKDKVAFNGMDQRPKVTVKYGGRTLKSGRDYIILYEKDYTAIGNYKVTISGQGNYTGSTTKDFQIANDFTKCLVTLSKTSVTYNGKDQKPTIIVKAKKDASATLKEGTDYTVASTKSYVTPGKYTIKISGKGNYFGVKTVFYTINKASKIVAFKQNNISKEYRDKAFTMPLSSSSVKPTSYVSSNIKVAKVDSTGKVTIVGVGKVTITATYKENSFYKGAKASYTLVISKSNNSITASNVTKTISSKAQTFKLKISTKGKATLNYSSSSKSVKVKSGKVIIAKNFVGKATITIKAASNTNYNAVSKKITITVNPAGTKITYLKKKSGNKFLLKWSKNSKVSGYEIQYATKNSFSKASKKTISKYSSTSYTASKLKKKTTYYVRIRTYKKVGKTKYYSGWSSVKYVKN